MSKAEQKAYLIEYMEWTDDDPNQEGTDLSKLTEEDMEYPFQ